MKEREHDILTIIKNEVNSFSKRQKMLAEYILNNYDKASYMTATQLGKITGVSESTVVRFATVLGFEGYQQLQKSLKEATIARLNSLQRMEIASKRMGENILDSVLKTDVKNILSTLSEIDKQQFDLAIKSILDAKNIYITGVRSASAIASFAGFYFNLLFDNVKLINTTGADDIFEQLLRVGAGDVVVGISFPRYSKSTVEAMEYAEKCGACVIGITDNKKSPIVKFSRYCLFAKSNMDSFADSLVAPLSVVNALIAAISIKKKDEVVRTFEKLENIWAEYEVYDKE